MGGSLEGKSGPRFHRPILRIGCGCGEERRLIFDVRVQRGNNND